MKMDTSGTGMSLSGIAVLAACACGTGSRIAQITSSYGWPANLRTIHPLFVVFGSALVLAGLWRRNRNAATMGMAGVTLLLLGEFLAPPMSVRAGTSLTMVQILGFIASLIAAGVLVAAFYRAYPSKNPSASVTAMTGMAMATGCNCCLVTMALAAPGRVLLPDQHWAGANLSLYLVASALMAIGLGRLGGMRPALLALAGQAFLYFWLELPYAAMPAIPIHGVNANFIIKYPMMVAGSLGVMGAFVLAYRSQETTESAPPSFAEPAFGDLI